MEFIESLRIESEVGKAYLKLCFFGPVSVNSNHGETLDGSRIIATCRIA